MITIMETKKIVNNKELVDIACLSTDTKPTTGIMNGSMLIETDTGKVCIYNEEDGEWTEIGSGGGGGGSSDFSTAEVTVINNATHGFILTIPYIYNNIMCGYIDYEDIIEDEPFIVPIYKENLQGISIISTDGEYAFSMQGSGGVIKPEIGPLRITGDGVLTITDTLS